MPLTGNNVEQKIWNYFKNKGLSEFGIAGLMGNLYAESGLIFNRVEMLCLQRLRENGKVYTDASYTQAVDSGKISAEEFLHPLPGKQYGYGIAQWTSPGRKSVLYTMAKSRGVSIADPETSLDFLWKELTESYSGVLSVLKSAKSVKEASDAVLKKFECPADTGTGVQTKRTGYGQEYYKKYAEKSAGNMGGITMGKTKISNSGHDENGRYSGGAAGDQTGTEWQVIDWYNRPWTCVLRHPDAKVRELLAELAREAADNNHIGYDQNQRDTFWQQLQKSGYHPKNITVNCESDCSAGVIAMTKAVGHLLGLSKLKNLSATYTGNMRAGFKAAGFEVLTEAKYLTGCDYLLSGDVLLNDQHHTAVNLTDGIKTPGTVDKGYLEKGDSGSAVKTMQTMLIKLGYSCGSAGADGDFGSGTEAALRKFQSANGLAVDGQYGQKSKTKLEELYKKATGASTGKTVDELAKEVIANKWGTGDARKTALQKAGYDYSAVQKRVNEILSGASGKKSVMEITKEVLTGKWGNGEDRKKKLQAAGYNYAEVQKKVNELLK